MNLPSQGFSVVPLVPAGRRASEFAVQEVAQGVLGTRDLVSGTFVPAVRTGAPTSAMRAVPAGGGLFGVGGMILGVANLGLGIFNGFMSWKMNKKLNRVLAAQAEHGRDIREMLDLVRHMNVDAERRHAEVMSGFDRLIAHDLRSKILELNDRLESLAEGPIASDAHRVLDLSAEAAGKIQSVLREQAPGSADRLDLIKALAFTRVAESDARVILAATDPDHLLHAARIRDKAAEEVSRELRSTLASRPLAQLLEGDVPLPVEYWGLRAGLQALPVTQEEDEPVVLDIRWESEGLDRIRRALSAKPDKDATTIILPTTLEDAEVLRQMQGAPTVGEAAVWKGSSFLTYIGRPKQSANTARQVFDAVVDSGWHDAFADDIEVGARPSRAYILMTLDEIDLTSVERQQELVDDDEDEDDVSTYPEALVVAALKQYEDDEYEDDRPLRAELVLRAARELTIPRPDLVDRAVIAVTEQRLSSWEATGAVLADDLREALTLAASRGEPAERSRAAVLSAKVHALEGRQAEAMALLSTAVVPRFDVEDTEWIVPLLRVLEQDVDAARDIYRRWLGAEHSESVGALCKARRSIVVRGHQRSGPGRKSAEEFRRALKVLETDEHVPRLVLEWLRVDFATAQRANDAAARHA